jgi:hypothetical protein
MLNLFFLTVCWEIAVKKKELATITTTSIAFSLKPVGKQLFLMEKKSELETVNINLLQ